MLSTKLADVIFLRHIGVFVWIRKYGLYALLKGQTASFEDHYCVCWRNSITATARRQCPLFFLLCSNFDFFW